MYEVHVIELSRLQPWDRMAPTCVTHAACVLAAAGGVCTSSGGGKGQVHELHVVGLSSLQALGQDGANLRDACGKCIRSSRGWGCVLAVGVGKGQGPQGR